jgi:exo-beta-1,3-glucanase (GH17 family)
LDPFFAYKDNPNSISLDYVLFGFKTRVMDPHTNLQYDNILYAQVDAVIYAIVRIGFGGIEVQVSETGWPSKGDPGQCN